MKQRFSSELQSYIQERKWKRRWHVIFFVFACLVVYVVLHYLTFPAISMTKTDIIESQSENSDVVFSDAAKVTFHFKETISIESQHQVAVLHFEEDGVQQPDITDIAVQNNNEMTDLSFDTEGFSVYAMVTWSETLDLDGQSYAIVNINENSTKWKPEIISAAMMDQVSNQTLTSSVCSVMQIGSEYYISSNDQFTEWHFEKYEDGYAIWSETEENKNYINTAWTKTNGDGGLKLSDKPETFYLERDTTGKYAGQMRIRNAKDYAINWCGGGNKNKL